MLQGFSDLFPPTQFLPLPFLIFWVESPIEKEVEFHEQVISCMAIYYGYCTRDLPFITKEDGTLYMVWPETNKSPSVNVVIDLR